MLYGHKDRNNRIDITLVATNGTPIPTYGQRLLQLDLGIRRCFQWPFVVADVRRPIIGADFLSYFNLLVDMRRKRLVDGETTLSAAGTLRRDQRRGYSSWRRTRRSRPFWRSFPPLRGAPFCHHKRHHIETKGPPAAARARRLPPDRLKAARQEFNFMLQQGLCRPSKRPWASPLHLRSVSNILAGEFVFRNSDRGEISHHHLRIVDLSVGVAWSSQGMVG